MLAEKEISPPGRTEKATQRLIPRPHLQASNVQVPSNISQPDEGKWQRNSRTRLRNIPTSISVALCGPRCRFRKHATKTSLKASKKSAKEMTIIEGKACERHTLSILTSNGVACDLFCRSLLQKCRQKNPTPLSQRPKESVSKGVIESTKTALLTSNWVALGRSCGRFCRQAATKSQNSGENWSGGSTGAGLCTMNVSRSQKPRLGACE